jgi:hypothetical protein
LVNCDKIILGSIVRKKSRFYLGLLEHKSREATIMASPTLFSPLVYYINVRRNSRTCEFPGAISFAAFSLVARYDILSSLPVTSKYIRTSYPLALPLHLLPFFSLNPLSHILHLPNHRPLVSPTPKMKNLTALFATPPSSFFLIGNCGCGLVSSCLHFRSPGKALLQL